MLNLFNQPWALVPTAWIDTETTGIRAGVDKACQAGVVRFEGGAPVGEFVQLVNPGIPIPTAATDVHGIVDKDVEFAPPIETFFGSVEVQRLLDGAQPAAYNAPFDRNFIPPFGDWTWPWLDALSIVRHVDQFVKGTGRHQLEKVAFRRNLDVGKVHDAGADAKLAGQVFYLIAPEKFGPHVPLGEMLRWQRVQEAEQWFRFMRWKSTQPERTNA